MHACTAPGSEAPLVLWESGPPQVVGGQGGDFCGSLTFSRVLLCLARTLCSAFQNAEEWRSPGLPVAMAAAGLMLQLRNPRAAYPVLLKLCTLFATWPQYLLRT
eukprot:jgi/Ulvmu1/9604/UM054_0034.1